MSRLRLRERLTFRIARFLNQSTGHYELRAPNDFERLRRFIRKGDVLLVDGDLRVSSVIKTLTQSSWSHAALYIGDELLRRGGPLGERALEAHGDDARHMLIEALFEGVVATPLDKYVDFNVRLCRPHRLRSNDLKRILDDAIAAIGWRYDLRNILGLAGHLIGATLRPARYRKQVVGLGSGTTTEVICTSLLGRLFHEVGFPVRPEVVFPEGPEPRRPLRRRLRWLRRRERALYAARFRRQHPTLLTPRDFDLSPYFEIVKFNAIEQGDFDYQRIDWWEEDARDAD